MNDLLPVVWSDFHFLRPTVLWGLAAVVFILILGIFNLRTDSKWKKRIAPHLRPYVISKGSQRIRMMMLIVQIVAFVFGIFALAGPTWKKVQLPGRVLETPVVILLDLSQSMMAEDIQPSRLERAKFKINDFLQANPRARIALVGYAGTAHTIVPLTRDYKIIESHIETLSPKVIPFRGSDLEKAIVLADTLMSVTTAPGTLLIFSDDFTDRDFDLIQNFTTRTNNKVDIMPINTPAGANVPAFNGRGSLYDGNEPVHSAINMAALNRINGLENTTVHKLTLDKSDVELIAKYISEHLKFTEKPEEKKDQWSDVGLLFAIPSAFLFLFWFRKGWVVFSFLFLITLGGCDNPNEMDSFADLWYTRDYQGQKQSDAGDYEAAASLYKDPLRQGVAYFKSGDYDDAIRSFSRDTSSMGAFNLGLAYFKSGDLAAAQVAFGEAITKDPDNAAAKAGYDQLGQVLQETSEASKEDAEEAGPEKQMAEMERNKSMEDLSGGGQKATKKDMEKKRMEETVNTDIRKAKELNEVPDDFKAGKADNSQKVLLQKLDDDPAFFLMRKFQYEAKRKNLKPNPDDKDW